MKITPNQFDDFLAAYYSTYKKNGLRLGQAFINYMLSGVVYPELFYETDDKIAIDMIVEEYVNY